MSFSPMPETSQTAQRMTALEQANKVRVQRAEIKRALFRAGTVRGSLLSLSKLVQEDPPAIQGMTFAELLESCYRIGKHRTRLILRRTGVSTTILLRELTPRQRYRIFAVLDEETR